MLLLNVWQKGQKAVMLALLVLAPFVSALNYSPGLTRLECGLPTDDDNPFLDVLALDLVSLPEHSSFVHQKPGLCVGLKYLNNVTQGYLSNYTARLFSFELAEGDGGKLSLLLESNEYSFVGILTPTIHTKALSRLLQGTNLTVVSYLYDNDLSFTFDQYFPVNYRQVFLNEVYEKIFDKLQWKRVAIIEQEGSTFQYNIGNNLRIGLSKDGIFAQHFLAASRLAGLKKGENLEILLEEVGLFQIFVILLNDANAAHLFCGFKNKRIYGDNFAMFGLKFWEFDSWINLTNCSDLNETMDHNLFFVDYSGIVGEDDRVLDAGITIGDYKGEIEIYQDYFHESSIKKLAYVYDSGFVTDALWSLFLFKINEMQDDPISKADLIGASGSIELSNVGSKFKERRFDNTVDLVIYQVVNNSISLATVRSTLEKLEPETLNFKGGIPVTEFGVIMIYVRKVQLIVLIPACIALVFCAISISAFILFREKPGIKILSPKINLFCGVGCIVSFATIIFHSSFNITFAQNPEKPSNCARRCLVYDLVLGLGFWLSFASIVVKQYRVHLIFNFIKQVPKDKILILAVITSATLRTVVIYLYRRFWGAIVSRIVILQDPDYAFSPQGRDAYEICVEEKPYGWVFPVCLNYSLLFIALFFAWTTRNVKISLLNDSTKIGSLVLTILLLFSVHASSLMLFEGEPASVFFINVLDTLALNIIVAIQLFLPGMIRLITDSDWKPNTSSMSPRFENPKEIKKGVEHMEELRSVEEVFELYKKTQELWKDLELREHHRESIDAAVEHNNKQQRETREENKM